MTQGERPRAVPRLSLLLASVARSRDNKTDKYLHRKTENFNKNQGYRNQRNTLDFYSFVGVHPSSTVLE